MCCNNLLIQIMDIYFRLRLYLFQSTVEGITGLSATLSFSPVLTVIITWLSCFDKIINHDCPPSLFDSLINIFVSRNLKKES